MKGTPVNTYGLCEGIQRGDKFKVRGVGTILEKGTMVEIADLCKDNPPPQCKNLKAKLLQFKDHGSSPWHPLWVINCHECPFYDPTLSDRDISSQGKNTNYTIEG